MRALIIDTSRVRAGEYVDQSDRARKVRARSALARVRNWYFRQPWQYQQAHQCPRDPWHGIHTV